VEHAADVEIMVGLITKPLPRALPDKSAGLFRPLTRSTFKAVAGPAPSAGTSRRGALAHGVVAAVRICSRMAVGQRRSMAQASRPADRSRCQQARVGTPVFTQPCTGFFCLDNAKSCASPDQLHASAVERSWAMSIAATLRSAHAVREAWEAASDRSPAQTRHFGHSRSQIGQPPKNRPETPKAQLDHTVEGLVMACPPLICRVHIRPRLRLGRPAHWQKPQWSSHPVDPSRLVPLAAAEGLGRRPRPA